MSKKDKYVFGGVWILTVLVSFFLGGEAGIILGNEQVASGRVVCKLLENYNKTTSWNCKDVKE